MVPRASISFGEQVQMIIEAIIGIAMNLIVADSATGQTVSKGLMMYHKLDTITKEGVEEEVHQLVKDAILEQGEK